MAGKSKRNVPKGEGGLAGAKDRVRNRASPACVVSLNDWLSPDQKDAVKGMDLGSMLDIKCSTLHNPLINWLAPKYDRFSRSFVIPGRGRIPLTASSVYHSMGLPRGDVHVRYALDREVEARLRPVLFPGHANTPETTKVFTILKDMTTAEKPFKQIYIMYLISTVLAPTSLNKVSSRCYPIMDKVDDVKDMNLCQFVCDKLHEELSVGKLSAACLLHMILLYVDSLDVSGLNIDLPEGTFLVNIWSKENIDIVLDADMKRDYSGFGNLELKPHLAIDHCFFGGNDGFQGFIDTNCARNCPKARKEKVARLVGEFSAGMTRLLATLVQGWTEVDDCDAIDVEKSFGEISRQYGVDGSPNVASANNNLDTFTAGAKKAGDIPRPSGSANKSLATSSPSATEAAGTPTPSPNVASPNNNQAMSSPCAKNTPDIRSPSAHGPIMKSPASVTGRVTRSSSSSKRARDFSHDQVENMDCEAEQIVSSGSGSQSRDLFVQKETLDVGGSVGAHSHGADEAVPKVIATDIDDNDLHETSVAHLTSEGHNVGGNKNSADETITACPTTEPAKNMLTTGIYQSGHNKRKTKDSFQTGIASSYDDEVVARKKPRVATPKRKARKVEQKVIRSSPRFIVKENVNTGPSCESKAATASAVEVGKANLHSSKRATLVKFEVVEPPLCANVRRDLKKGDDPHIIYVTPAMSTQPLMSAASITPGTSLRIARVVQPSRFLLPPYSRIVSTPEQDDLYEQVIKHHSKSKDSKINGLMFLQISPMWVTTGDLADSIMPTGELSNTVVEIGISVLQESCDTKKIIFPYILTEHLLQHKFDSRVVQQNFRRDGKYKLSHKDVLLFAVLQDLGTAEEPQGHWYTLGLNFKAMRFEVLDSCRGSDDVSLIQHASFLVDAIKTAYKFNYSTSARQIDDYQLQYIDVPKQKNTLDCGYFMLRFLQEWDGRNVPAVTFDQIPAYRKILAWTWLNHKRNRLLNWRELLESNKL